MVHLTYKVNAAYEGIETMGGQVHHLGTDYTTVMEQLQEMERSIITLTEADKEMQEDLQNITGRVEALEGGEQT